MTFQWRTDGMIFLSHIKLPPSCDVPTKKEILFFLLSEFPETILLASLKCDFHPLTVNYILDAQAKFETHVLYLICLTKLKVRFSTPTLKKNKEFFHNS